MVNVEVWSNSGRCWHQANEARIAHVDLDLNFGTSTVDGTVENGQSGEYFLKYLRLELKVLLN